MKVKSFFVKLGKLSVGNGVIIAFCTGIFLVATAWVLSLLNSGSALTLAGLWQLHIANPALWIVDLLPFGLGTWYYCSAKLRLRDRSIFQAEIQTRDLRRQHNAKFVGGLGEVKLKMDISWL